MMISAFSYVHNAIEGGYPIVEAISAVLPFVDELMIVEAESTDGTMNLLTEIQAKQPNKIRIIGGSWGTGGGETLAHLHSLHAACVNGIILHFEADEVWDPFLAHSVCAGVRNNTLGPDVRVWRLQIEQNFQRIRWYPEPVHRVFPKNSVIKVGQTTDRDTGWLMKPETGFLWDCTNCFRDNWIGRLDQQSKLRGDEPLNVMAVPGHASLPPTMGDVSTWSEFFEQDHWTWTETPLAIPDILKPLVGKAKYEPKVHHANL